jgi:uncharacterized damage-inducible protein DinB
MTRTRSSHPVEVHPQSSVRTCESIAAPVAALLDELRAVMATLSQDQYTRPSGPHFSGGTIGGHVRHVLDHVRAVVVGASSGVVDYDHRERGTSIETDVAAADAETARLRDDLVMLACRSAESPVNVCVIPARGAEAVTLGSTLARELAFALSHTVHHNATIRGMLVELGRHSPDSFGYAPSTLTFQDSTRCVR